jgi:hypothetical protein
VLAIGPRAADRSYTGIFCALVDTALIVIRLSWNYLPSLKNIRELYLGYRIWRAIKLLLGSEEPIPARMGGA